MLNVVTIMGRLTADPELKHTQSGIPVCTIRVAVDRDSKDKNSGERQTDFISAVAWNGAAEFLHKYFTKGRLICITGRLQSREYITQAGDKRTLTEINIRSAYFADSKREDAPKGGGPYYAAAPALTDDDAPPAHLPF